MYIWFILRWVIINSTKLCKFSTRKNRLRREPLSFISRWIQFHRVHIYEQLVFIIRLTDFHEQLFDRSYHLSLSCLNFFARRNLLPVDIEIYMQPGVLLDCFPLICVNRGAKNGLIFSCQNYLNCSRGISPSRRAPCSNRRSVKKNS